LNILSQISDEKKEGILKTLLTQNFLSEPTPRQGERSSMSKDSGPEKTAKTTWNIPANVARVIHQAEAVIEIEHDHFHKKARYQRDHLRPARPVGNSYWEKHVKPNILPDSVDASLSSKNRLQLQSRGIGLFDRRANSHGSGQTLPGRNLKSPRAMQLDMAPSFLGIEMGRTSISKLAQTKRLGSVDFRVGEPKAIGAPKGGFGLFNKTSTLISGEGLPKLRASKVLELKTSREVTDGNETGLNYLSTNNNHLSSPMQAFQSQTGPASPPQTRGGFSARINLLKSKANPSYPVLPESKKLKIPSPIHTPDPPFTPPPTTSTIPP
jgi:hypothetical protein